MDVSQRDDNFDELPIQFNTDTFFMEQALRQARRAMQSGEVPVGAVITHKGEIIARSHNQVETLHDATAHAEMLALSQAQEAFGDWRLTDCDLYVTKEPCPMCAGAIVHCRVRRVIFGVGDPKGGAAGGLLNILQQPTLNHRCEISPGILEAESLGLLRSFFRNARLAKKIGENSENGTMNEGSLMENQAFPAGERSTKRSFHQIFLFLFLSCSFMHFQNLSPQPDIGANSYLLESEGVRIVLDSGTHPKHTGWETLPLLDHLESDSLDGILVSHPHLDHLGSLPVLMRSQPSAEVGMTRLTREYGSALLHNSVNVMTAQAEELDEPLYPLYTHGEIDAIVRRWNLHDVGNRFFPGDQTKLSAEFFHAGHVLGAAGIRIEAAGKTLFFTGDVHFEDQTLVKAAEFPRQPVDTLVMETTRGASPRDPGYTRDSEKQRLATVITQTLARGGSVLIPVFAFGKTQEVLLMLRELFDEGLLPTVPVHIGGLSTKITEITDRFCFDSHRRHSGYNILNDFPSLKRLAKGRREPDYQPGAIYALSSGMMTEHTVSHRFAHRILASEQNSLLFVGYADPDSPGGQILAAGQGGRVHLDSKLEKEVEIRCQVERFDFSGHAPREQLIDYAVACRPKNVLLVHGDPAAKQWFQGELSRLLPSSRVFIPAPGEKIEL